MQNRNIISHGVNHLFQHKYKLRFLIILLYCLFSLSKFLNECYGDCSKSLMLPFLFSSGFNIICCTLAGLCIFLVPEASKSVSFLIRCLSNEYDKCSFRGISI